MGGAAAARLRPGPQADGSRNRLGRSKHAALVALGVTEMNTSAMQFYKHLGYRDIGLRVPWPPDPSKQIIILGKELKG